VAQVLTVTELASLPSVISETSGLENGPDGCFWTHNDSGNDPILYCVDTTGTIVRTVAITGAVNTDWEDPAKDAAGNMYIGDFGNNLLGRTDLKILVVPNIDAATTSAAVTDTIRFSYPDQFDYPPNGSYGNFDMEAMVAFNDSLFLFSKDRSNPPTGYTKIYQLPTQNGTYIAELKDSFDTEQTNASLSVTAADISEDGTQLVLLNANRIWLFSNYSGSDFFGGDVAQLLFFGITQKEGIVFRNGFMYVTDELFFGFGGAIYRVATSLITAVTDRSKQLEITPIYTQDMTLKEIRLSDISRQITWQIFTVDGKLLQDGTVKNSTVLSSEIKAENGIYVIRISENGTALKSMMVRL